MAKSKHAKPDEELLGEIRSLRKLIKSLRQRIRQLEKKEYTFDDAQSTLGEDPIPELPVGKNNQRYCPECSKGILDIFDIMDRVFEQCKICGYRKKIK